MRWLIGFLLAVNSLLTFSFNAQAQRTLLYDNGNMDMYVSPWSTRAGSEIVVRFKPDAYPVKLSKILFYVSTYNIPNTPFEARIYEDDNGYPGERIDQTSLQASASETGGEWVTVNVSDQNIIIREGVFYAGMYWSTAPGKDGTQAQSLGFTQNTSTVYRSYFKYGHNEFLTPYSENALKGNAMIRVLVEDVPGKNILPVKEYLIDNFDSEEARFKTLGGNTFKFVMSGNLAFLAMDRSTGFLFTGGENPGESDALSYKHSNYFEDVDVTADFQFQSGSKTGVYGITVGNNDTGFILFGVSNSGNRSNDGYIIGIMDTNGTFASLADKNAGSVLTATERGDLLKVSVVGQNFKFYINESLVEALTIDTYHGGGVGLYAHSDVAVNVSYFHVLDYLKAECRTLPAPVLTTQKSETDVMISWLPVDCAVGYTFAYAPYPSVEWVEIVEMASKTTITASQFNGFFDGAAFYVAVVAYNDQEMSKLSNIEYYVIKSTDGQGIQGSLTTEDAAGVWQIEAEAFSYDMANDSFIISQEGIVLDIGAQVALTGDCDTSFAFSFSDVAIDKETLSFSASDSSGGNMQIGWSPEEGNYTKVTPRTTVTMEGKLINASLMEGTWSVEQSNSTTLNGVDYSCKGSNSGTWRANKK